MTGEADATARLKESLANTELFAELNDEQLNRLAQVGEVRSYKRGDVIFKQGAEGSHFYVICAGAVRVSQTVPGIGEEAFAVLRQGTVFGEMSVFDDAPRSAVRGGQALAP